MLITTPAQIIFPLDIPQADVVPTKQTQDRKFIVTGAGRQETAVCGICQQEISCNYGVGQETYIAIRPRRGRCPTCVHSPTTTQKLNWYEQQSPHTKACDQYLIKQLIGNSVSDVSLKEKVRYNVVLGTPKRQVDSEVNWDEVQNLDTIGIDEVAYKKGHTLYRTIVTARQDDGTTSSWLC